MANENKGFYKLSWLQRIGFGSGDMAQNLIYQTISIWLLFYYTNVFKLDPIAASTMFLVVRLIDVLWDPVVGALIDKKNPKWGKYRSWLVLGGIPLTGFAILCFWHGVENHRLLYAYITYVGMSMCYTLVNVPYGAINSSLTRDTNEITILTSTRMFMANVGGLIVKTVPLIVAGIYLGQQGTKFNGIGDFFKQAAANDTALKSADSAPAWFLTMLIFALVGFAFLIFCFSQSKERVVMDEKESANVKTSDLFTEFVRNRPLRVLAFFFITAFAMMSVSNAADSYYMTYNMKATSGQTTLFMWLGTIPAFIFMPLVPAIKRKIGKNGMFYLFLSCAIVGMVLQFLYSKMTFSYVIRSGKMTDFSIDFGNYGMGNFWILCVIQFIKSTGIIVATGYMWALVPEVVAYGEYKTGRRIAGIVNALTGIFFKAGMALGGVIPGLVLGITHFNAERYTQLNSALNGILVLVCVIPAVLLLLAMWIISKYELTDEKMDEINKEIEARAAEK